MTAGDVINGTTLTAANLQTLKANYKSAASLSSDGKTIIIGTGTEKIDRSIVPEIGNKYTATTSQAQNIKTGSNDWIVVATSSNDTITTGGADSINSGAGSDKITVGADYASILTGAGNDSVEISATVKDVTLKDLNSSDVLKISGTFDVGSAKIEDTMLVITDKTGTRKIRLGDFDTAKNAKINSTTIGTWLANAGINLNNLSATSSSNELPDSGGTEIAVGDGDEGQIEIDPDYTPTPIQTTPTENTEGLPKRSSNSTGEVNVNLDNVTLTSGNLEIDGNKVGEISNEFPNVNSFTKNGLTINLVGTTSNTDGYPSNFTSKTFDQLTDDQKTIVAGLFKWWGKECLQLNEESYGISFNSPTAMVKEIGLYFYDSNGSGNTLAAVWNWSSGASTTKLMLNVNMNYYSGIDSNNFDGESSGTLALLDRTLAHEFTHAIMATNISYFNSLPQFIKEGSAELTHGIDDERGQSIFGVAYDADRLSNAISLSNTGTGTADAYSGGYMFLRYFAKQAALQAIVDDLENVNPLLITLTENADTYTNEENNISVLGGAGDDTIYNWGSSVTIDGGDGNDSISNNWGSSVTIDGGDGNDSISNNWAGSSVTIDGGAGDDSIYNRGNNVTIDGGDGNDTISNNWGSSVTIDGGDGNDSISNNWAGSSVTIDGGAGDDSIYNRGNNVTIDGGDGSDTIGNYSSQVSLNGGVSNDSIDNTGDSVTIDGGAGNDSIRNVGNSVTISGGAGDDDIYNSSLGTSVTIDGGAGNDSIKNGGSNVTINVGDDNDTIYNYGDSVTIDAGAGNDSIRNESNNVTIDGGAGDDDIDNNGDSLTINGGAGNDYIDNYFGNNVTIDGGKGADTIYNNGKNVTIDAGNDNDTISNGGWNTSINGGAGNDSVDNFGKNVTIDGGAGDDYIYSDDYIYNNTGKNVSISGGEGNDSIYNQASKVTIAGGEGNDYIYNSSLGTSVTIDGGAGDDSIHNNFGNNVTIEAGEGNDSIFSRYSNSVAVDGGAGNDFVTNNATNSVTINTAQGNDTIKIGTASANSFKVENFGAGDVIELYTSVSKLETISGGIKAGNVSISGISNIATVNNSWSTSTNSIAYNQSTVAGAKVSGTKITYDASSATKNLFTIIGIKSTVGVSLSGYEVTLSKAALNGITGTVSISGGDYKLKLASDVDTIAENISGWTTLTSGNVAYLEGGKGSYYLLSGDKKSVTYNASVAGAKKVELAGVKGTPTLSGNTVSLTANNFNSNVNVVSNAGNYKFALSGAFANKKFTGTPNNDSIINAGSNISIDAGKGNDNITSSGSNVTITGGAGNDVFTYSNGNFKITDYTANADKISLDIAKVEDVTLNNKDVVLNLGQSNAITIANGKDKKITVAKSKTAQYIFGDHVILSSGKSSATLTSAATQFNAGSYSDMTTVNATKTKSAAQVVGNAKANKILAGANGSTLNGGKGNDTLVGGAGVDVFVYANKTGNDVIQNYTSGQDKISLGAGASVAGFSVNTSGDGVLKIGSNNLIIKKADGEDISKNGKKITIINAAGNEITNTYFTNKTISGNGKSATLNAEYTNTFTATGNIVTVDATQNENPLTIKGNSKNNVLTSGSGADKLNGEAGNDSISGGGGNDTLTGGKGNDTLTGNAGNDIFIYEAGNDVITDYTAGQDKIKIANGKVSKTSLSGSDVSLTVGSGSLTVKNAKGKTISLIDSAGKASSTVVGAQILSDSSKATISIAADMGAVDASKRTKAIKITGNTLANTISGGSKNDTILGGSGNDSLVGNAGNDKFYGGTGNDILKGGAGNDSLWGDAGKDTFIYANGDGKDVIYSFENSDMLKITGTFSGTYNKSKKEAYFKVGSTSDAITLKDFSATTFNVNGSNYKISGSKLVEK